MAAAAAWERWIVGAHIEELYTNPTLIGVFITFLLASYLSLISLGHYRENQFVQKGCQRLGVLHRSNLDDQYSEHYSDGCASHVAGNWTVKALFVYPVKSCAGVELDKSEVIRTGLCYDRQFSFAQWLPEHTEPGGVIRGGYWKFLTQRECPLLAKVETELWVPDKTSEARHCSGAEFVKSAGCIVVRFPSRRHDRNGTHLMRLLRSLPYLISGKTSTMVFAVPFNPPPERVKSRNYTFEELSIWKDSPLALNVGNEIPQAVLHCLRKYLGARNPITLFRVDPSAHREVFRCAPRKDMIGYQPVVGLADAYPLHLVNMSSVHHVASQLSKASSSASQLDVRRFRANIIVAGAPPFVEDLWIRISIVPPFPPETDGVESESQRMVYHVSCRTARCTLPNVDPATGASDTGNQPYAVMKSYRRIDKGAEPYPCLGMQVTPMFDGGLDDEHDEKGKCKRGILSVGDTVNVLEETNDHCYIKQ